MKCDYCKNNFTNKHILSKHQKTARYCLKMQNKDISYQHECEGCKKTFTIIYDLNIHRKKCKASSIFYDIQSNTENLTILNKELMSKLIEKDLQIEKHERTIKELQDKIENIAIKAIQKSSTTNVKNTQVNNYIQRMQPITQEHLMDHSPHLTLEHIKKGASGYAEYALEGPLKDRIACVDYSRRKIKFKDTDGNIITDPEMAKLAPMFFDSIKDKSSQLIYSLNTSDMDSAMFEGVANLFNTNADVRNGATGVKTEFFHDFIKHVCSGSVVE